MFKNNFMVESRMLIYTIFLSEKPTYITSITTEITTEASFSSGDRAVTVILPDADFALIIAMHCPKYVCRSEA